MHSVVMHHLLSLLLLRRRSILSPLLPLKRKSFDSFLRALESSIRGGHSLKLPRSYIFKEQLSFFFSSEVSDESLISN